MAAEFSLTGQIRLDPRWVDDLNTTVVTDSVRVALTLVLTNGTGTAQANAYWRDVRTVAASATDTISMTTGLDLDVYGGSGTVELDPDKLRLLYVRNLSDTVTLDLVLEDVEQLRLPPAGVLLLSRPADASFAGPNGGDVSIVNAAATAADYEVIIVGVQA